MAYFINLEILEWIEKYFPLRVKENLIRSRKLKY